MKPHFLGTKGSAGGLIASLLFAPALLLNGQGFGYLPLDSVPPGFAISPIGDSRVLVAWIKEGTSGSSVLAEEYRNGFSPDSDPQVIYDSARRLWSLKLETDADEQRFLSVVENLGSNFYTRLLRYDSEYREQAQSHWLAKSSFSPPGRMVGPDDRLFISTNGSSAAGRMVNKESLAFDGLITIQTAATIELEPGNKYETKTIYPSGLDTAIEDDGSVTALYQFSWLRLKRFGPDRRLKQSLLLDRPPFSYFTRSGMTAVAVNESRTSLLAWEWHEYAIIDNKIRTFPSIPAFRAIMADGTMTDTIRLEPASPSSDRHDRPAVGLRPDGTGAVAWTVRTGLASAVWLQRLDADLGAYEPPRLVDARPGFHTDQPTIDSDSDGNLFLAWRCTAIESETAQIGILDLSQLDQAPASPLVACVAGKVQIDWLNRPASRNSLWYSSDLNLDHAQLIHHSEGLAGPCHHEHALTSASGFYWLSSN